MAFRSVLPALSRRAFAQPTVAGAAARSISSSTARQSENLFVHRDTDYNNPNIPFKFNEEYAKKVQTIISRYPAQYKKAAVIPVLDLGQRQNGWTSLAVMNHVAEVLEMPRMRVYEVATFYTMFNREPVGKHLISFCGTTPCQLGGVGAKKIWDSISGHLGGLKNGETTKDGKFTLIEVECLGACSNAPMIQINDDFYEDLTPETTIKILDALARGETPKPGPQSSRKTSENAQGMTTLTSAPYGPGEHCQPEFQ
ncbi:thioredoxin-like [2Fe-2S] ferredoxin-domain-containing protein [Filobasidium floriforme]|uniref:thioredoxin-like [2Fe-2S] ferredoxin-domain-containing protein n=1 Tax=Filobasidium floriforme TaxID=5210 RepID=UPI001E8CBF6F|nr:thioredoxin-like [2Fe-2S] ferredoxin-domain-containing protein [Filobasidium floriforme]KAH8090452.1 thioredoxin-like [2Fe-2S] ferredoxin-domain-containing protein [Filobasidium floriforme]